MRAPNSGKKVMLLGIGLDGTDGHTRATRGEHFRIVGGSHETHELMQEKCVKFGEKLKDRGKHLEQLGEAEFLDMAAECKMNVVVPGDEERET